MGIVENVEGPSLNLRLTQKGENLIYSSESQKSGREGGAGNSMFNSPARRRDRNPHFAPRLL